MPNYKGRRPSRKRPGPNGKNVKFAGRKKKRPVKPAKKKKKPLRTPQPSIESTGMEAYYLKELINNETLVVVVLNDGEKIRGHVRYYDKDMFSIGPVDGGPSLFLRKSGIRYLFEE